MQPNLLHALPATHKNDALSNLPYFLTPERVDCISQLLGEFMNERKPFLNKGYCIHDLANEIGIHAYQLSAYINQYLGMNFNEYFNGFRIRHCQELMQNGLVEQLNLSGLAYKCGFSNRNTLTTAFKKFTGVTPSGYGKQAV